MYNCNCNTDEAFYNQVTKDNASLKQQKEALVKANQELQREKSYVVQRNERIYEDLVARIKESTQLQEENKELSECLSESLAIIKSLEQELTSVDTEIYQEDRKCIAMAALNGLLVHGSTLKFTGPEGTARCALRYADALLAALLKPSEAKEEQTNGR